MNLTRQIGRPEFFTREMYFAWLLRSDVRKELLEESDSEIEAQKNFAMWWFLYGVEDYPNSSPPSAKQVAIAGEVVAENHGVAITRLMSIVLRSRVDVQEAYDVASEEGCAGFLRWFYVFGASEFQLFDLLSDSEFEHLRAPCESVDHETGSPISRIMYYVWLLRPDLRQVFPLISPESRDQFAAWFYLFGVREHKLHRYLHSIDVARLYEPEHKLDARVDTPVTRLMRYFWIVDQNLRGACDLQTVDGRRKLKEHVDQKLRSDVNLQPIWNLLHSRSTAVRFSRDVGDDFGIVPKEITRARKLELAKAGSLGVNLVGYAMGELGIGEDIRMMVKALEAAGVDFCVLNRQPGPEIRQMDFSIIQYLSPAPRYPITMICMTGFDTAWLWLDCPDLFKNTYVIGFWPWELPQWPREWEPALELVDEVWASSRYTHDAFASQSPVPVIQMPMAVTANGMEPHSRAEFGLPEDHFLFLFVFDFMSYPARKNPYACIMAFREAFPRGDEPVNLVLKVSNVVYDSPKWRHIQAMYSVDPRIIIWDKNLDKGSVLGLMQLCDAYVSLHRAEGFGRTLAEAMLLGKPVIATGYSGNVDFLTNTTGYVVDYSLIEIGSEDYPYGLGQVWAEPTVASAAARMREVYADRRAASKKGDAGRAYILKNHSPDVVGKQVKRKLQSLRNGTSKRSLVSRRVGKSQNA